MNVNIDNDSAEDHFLLVDQLNRLPPGLVNNKLSIKMLAHFLGFIGSLGPSQSIMRTLSLEISLARGDPVPGWILSVGVI